MTGQSNLLSDLWRPLLTLILVAGAIMGSPGPSTLSATAVGAAYGVRRSIAYVAGLILGTLAVLIAVAIGVVTALLSIPHGASVLVLVSSVYILYLAFRIGTAPPLRDCPSAARPAFAGGFLLAVANPKAYLAIAAVFQAARLVAGDHDALDAAVKTAVLGVMIVVIHIVWLAAGVSLARALRDPVAARVINVALAAALAATAVLAVMRLS